MNFKHQTSEANQVEAVGPDDRKAAQALPGHQAELRVCGVVHSTDVFLGI